MHIGVSIPLGSIYSTEGEFDCLSFISVSIPLGSIYSSEFLILIAKAS